jgi:hypothetical protein
MSLKYVSNVVRSRGWCVMRENRRGRTFTMTVLSVMGILSICACTSGGLYEEARQDTRRACLNKPPSIDRDRCLERNSHSYDEYTRERERVRREEESK